VANDTLEGNRHRGIPRQGASPHTLIDAIQGTLADFLAAQIGSLDSIDPALGRFARTARDLVHAGGKRLRPVFAYWGWRGSAGGDAPVEPVLPAFAALELMHTFALIHDDVMDESDTRRGRPTAHRIFAGQHEHDGGIGDPERFGSSAAILIGDLCLVWADQLLARAEAPPAVRACYDRMRVEAIAGQYLDVLGENQPGTWSVDRALLVARHKTASYTIQRPLQLGLALTGVGRPEIEQAYGSYGLAVGEAFQLRDDLLGVYGDPAVTGKPAGDDLRTGKPTALLMLARKLATPAQRAELTLDPAGAVNPADGSGGSTDAPTEGGLTKAQIERRAGIIAETGAPARLEAMIQERVADGVAALARAPIHEEARAALIELAVRVTHRPA